VSPWQQRSSLRLDERGQTPCKKTGTGRPFDASQQPIAPAAICDLHLAPNMLSGPE
jgi:hypothetical protein